MIEIKNMSFRYDTPVFEDVNLHLSESRIGLIGENGVGKTTLLKLISSELKPNKGEISACGNIYKAVTELNVYKEFTPREMLELCSNLKTFDMSWVAEYVEQLYLNDFLDSKIKTLSKGTHKKVGILLAMLSVQNTLLLDEPFESIDKKSNENLVEIINKQERTFIIVSHDHEFLAKCTDRIIRIENRKVMVCNG